MDYLEFLGRRLVWFVVSLVVVIVVKRPRLLNGLAIVSDEVIGKDVYKRQQQYLYLLDYMY